MSVLLLYRLQDAKATRRVENPATSPILMKAQDAFLVEAHIGPDRRSAASLDVGLPLTGLALRRQFRQDMSTSEASQCNWMGFPDEFR